MYSKFTKQTGIPPGYAFKLLLIMKLTTLILIGTLLQVSAASFAQRLSMQKNNASLKEIFNEIKRQTGYNVVWDAEQLKDAKPITANFKNAELAQVLESVMNGQPLDYTISDKTIVIKRKTPSFLDKAKSVILNLVKDITVRGRVIDADGKPIPGATIRVKGTNKTAISSQSGTFALKDVNENAMITISYIGYITREIKAEMHMGDIRLEMGSSELEEVTINKGYYKESKRLSTGSVGKVTADEISHQPVLNPLAALQARVPGLTITQQTGVPGGGFRVSIRGINSLRNQFSDYQNGTNGNDPLIIIDAIPYFTRPQTMSAVSSSAGIYPLGTGANPLNSINPSDIESIEILKDADATSIYGSRGANGVIIITTKRGREGKMNVDANFYTGAGKVTRKMELLNTEQYLEMRQEGYRNDNITTYPANAYDLNGTWDNQRYTDWQEELIGGTAYSTNGQLSISGGTPYAQYRIGGGYHKESSVFPGDFSSQRASASLSMNNTSYNQKFKSNISVNYSYGLTNLLTRDLTPIALKLSPNAPALFDSEGNLNFQNSTFRNPLAYIREPYSSNTNALISNARVSYQILSGLDLSANLGYSNTTMDQNSKTPISALDPNTTPAAKINRATYRNGTNASWIMEPQLSYVLKIGRNHTLSTLLGTTFQKETSKFLNQTASGFLNESLMDNISAVPAANVVNTFDDAVYKYNAAFGRINYDYRNKYLINLTGRRDGSSRFGPGKQFANFGAIGAAWIFTEENIMEQHFNFLSFGKIRASYGTTGNDQITNYGFLDAYTTTGAGQYQNSVGLKPSQLFNPDFSWETTEKAEAALELGFLRDRIKFSTAYYSNLSSNQLVGYVLPSSTGFTSVLSNWPATVRNTGWEFELNTTNLKATSITWSTSFNISIPQNKLVAFPDFENSSYALTAAIGEPLGINKVYQYIGVDAQTGLHQISDIDGNGLLNASDRSLNKFVGQWFNGGLSNSIQYKGVHLDFLFQFVKQQGQNYLLAYDMPGAMTNFPAEIMNNRWQRPGDIAAHQRFSAGSAILPYFNYILSDAAITDASYIRLKNISLSYTLPQSLLNELSVKQLRLYFLAQNLFTITKYRGLDPETQGTTLPPLRLLTAGVQLNF